MKLEDLGYKPELEKHRTENKLLDFPVGRVISEHKERYRVLTAEGEFEAEITGNLRFTARTRADFPATGDWVALSIYDSESAIIHQILPRSSLIKRQAVGQTAEIQVIAANVDFALIVQAIDRDYSINRLERYLTICYASGVSPIILLSKIDLIDEQRIAEIQESIRLRVQGVPIIALSNESQKGIEELKLLIEKGKSYCLLGSSGVGKSSLLNNLSGKSVMETAAISRSTNRGKHVTTHRELLILENGGILIDNPGMREVGLADSGSALEITFNQIIELSSDCKFVDCTHTRETGCAVLEALERGEIDPGSYQNYLKMAKEQAHFDASLLERRQKDKEFGKFMKNYKKDLKKK